MKPSTIFKLVGVGVVSIFLLFSVGSLVEWVEPQEYVRIQYPNGGHRWSLTPGPVPQWWGTVAKYKQRGTIFFKNTEETGDARLPITFNEGGTAKISGSINYELPPDEAKLNEIHAKYPNQDALELSLIKPALNNSIYLAGTLMTSYESYKERRNQLVQYVVDTIQNGVYQTETKEIEVTDELDPTKKKRATVVEILRVPVGQPRAGQPQRTDDGQLNRFGVRTFNFSIEGGLDYDETVKAQIASQQKITMQVQTSIAEAKQAEQKKITTEAEGAANAATAKWTQEAIKAKLVTEAQQKLEVATLDNQSAEQTRQAILKIASGEAEARRLKMAADGALEQKLKAYVDVNGKYADAIAKYQGNWVPQIQTGGAGSGNSNGAQALIDLLTVKTAKDLGLDSTPGSK